MAGLVDSHLHFDVFDGEGQVEAVLDRARAAGVRRMLAVGGSDEANARVVRLCRAHPGTLAGVVGYDRDEAGRGRDPAAVERLLGEPGVVGIGETGLDYHYGADTASAQQALLEEMLDLAARHRLPVVLHSRDADADTLRLLGAHARRWPGPPDRIGVLHCFTGSRPFADRLLDLGFAISFSGIVTFARADELRRVAAAVPDDRLLIETDAPYLAPVPHRGRRNEPALLPHTAAVLAGVRGCRPEALAALTAGNAQRLFGWEEPGA